MLRTILVVLALFALVAVPTAAQEDLIVVEPGDPVVLGLAAVLSGEGLAPIGEDIVRGAELALVQRPTVTVGEVEFEVVFDIQDDLCSAEGGQAIGNYFAAQPAVVGVVGPTCSSACNASATIFDQAGYTSISASCTNPLLAQDFESFIRTAPSDAAQGADAAIFIFDYLGLTKIATIHDGSAYGEGLVDVLSEAFVALGGEVVAADAVTVGDTDFRSTLDAVAAAGPELIFFGGFPAEAARLAEQRADAGLAEVAFMGADGIKTTEFIDLAGEVAEGVYVSSPAPVTSDVVTAFIEAYVEEFGIDPTGPYNTNAADAVNMFLDGIEAVGTINADGNLEVSRAALREFLLNYGAEEAVEGITGLISCNGDGECVAPLTSFAQVQMGEFVTLEDVNIMEMEETEE
ncbi:MAG: branched-chain amino acid ABC transporter substrate-binding protein [Anaerolineae bacterium]|jgi:branched-chain amino acid transport system substrate-binding protein|nr:branched-chain amino acid ABC transporter substrate-binding protein [Anaerolineae bacterium]